MESERPPNYVMGCQSSVRQLSEPAIQGHRRTVADASLTPRPAPPSDRNPSMTPGAQTLQGSQPKTLAA
jgi:hypothetical protein